MDTINKNSREYLETVVTERANHSSAEDVRTTCSFARAERLLGREYHGRFLIELLQNAADAWRSDPRSRDGRSRLAVLVGKGPALLVANQGVLMTPAVVIDSLGHIGASTKAEGEAIGHKGIGFKSVLEITMAPEIYSGLQQPEPVLSVSFDAQRAERMILTASPQWNYWLSAIQGLDASDPFTAIPVLRFPEWQEAMPAEVTDLKRKGYDTVIRLPFSPSSANRLGLSSDDFINAIRGACEDVTDQILLLLGCFSEVRIEDRLASSEVLIAPKWATPFSYTPRSDTREDVSILRNGKISSRWRLFRRTLSVSGDLAGEIAVGLRYDLSDAQARTVLPAIETGPSAPFHLFFPTRIPSGLPFLVHGYFQVDASRTGFYRGSTSENRAILDALATLVTDVVDDTAIDPDIDQATLVNQIAACDEPEEPLAQSFRAKVLELLDNQTWLPVGADAAGVRRASPSGIFAVDPRLAPAVAKVFSPEYVAARVKLAMPEPDLSDRALELIRSRQLNALDLWNTLHALCRPGDMDIWGHADADDGFLALLDLLDALRAEDRAAVKRLTDGLRGEPAARLVPVPDTTGGRTLLPVPDPSPGRRGRLVMARVRATGGVPLAPPKALDVSFLQEGLLNEADIDRANPLGVRPFTVDNLVDRLHGIGQSNADPEVLLRFLWRLLSREAKSAFGTERAAERASVFDPSAWFWCRPGRAQEDDAAGDRRQQRERYLTEVLLPSRQEGVWKPAGSLAFGADWAEWLQTAGADSASAGVIKQRVAAYQALEAISPGPEALLAPPEIVLAQLDGELSDSALDSKSTNHTDGPSRNTRCHAFLLRLGVWEVPPIEAFSDLTTANREPFPWTNGAPDRQQSAIAAAGGWTFGLNGWRGSRHHNVYLAEDYRFAWPLDEAAKKDAAALARGLQLGIRLYQDRLAATVFCHGCKDSGTGHSTWRYSGSSDGYPSQLALQLRDDAWLSCKVDGIETEDLWPPKQAWWRDRPLVSAGLRQSPWRLLPLSDPTTGMTEDLRRLAGTNTMEGADLSVIGSLLARLREDYEAEKLAIDPATSASARQAFVGLHRLAYERCADIAVAEAKGIDKMLAKVGVLCELGDQLVFRQPSEARHDDGRFSTYVRHFAGKVPFIVLPRDQDARASRLGIDPLQVSVTREGDDDGIDVTDQVHSMLADRIHEFLAIVVHHSLGTQTLEPDSERFKERARRLQAVTVRYVPDLVVGASIEGSEYAVRLGEGSNQDIYLEDATTTKPVLYHDLGGDGWQDRLRRKLAPYIARILENPAYTHTIALFLQADGDAEREEFLLELGISGDEVDAIAARIGAVSEADKALRLRWYRALLATLGRPVLGELPLDAAELQGALAAAGLPDPVAQAMVEAGGGEAVRRNAGEGSPLRLLHDQAVNLLRLHTELEREGDDGLELTIAKRKFARWLDAHGRRVAVVLSTRVAAETAKDAPLRLAVPEALRFAIDPPLEDLLDPVVVLLKSHGLAVQVEALFRDPPTELARIGEFESAAVLDEQVQQLFNKEEHERVLSERATKWQRLIRRLAILSRMGPAETRARVRTIADGIDASLTGGYAAPSHLIAPVDAIFIEHEALKKWLIEQLVDSVLVEIPTREDLLERAAKLGIDVDKLPVLERALDAPRRDQAQKTRMRAQELRKKGIAPRTPEGLSAPPSHPTPSATDRKPIAAVKVEARYDRRKRELGDEGEQWALASVIRSLLDLDAEARGRAIGDICQLLNRFKGTPVDAALGHAERARLQDLEEDELIEELAGLLHLSRHSDAFGFDLVGWLPVTEGAEPTAVCLEVKSVGGNGFILSASEWARAEWLHNDGEGDRYAVLAVRRGKGAGTPIAMDLLIDPVRLYETNQLRRDADGYKIAYGTLTTSSLGSSEPDALRASTATAT